MLGVCGTKIAEKGYQLVYSGGNDSKKWVGVILLPELTQRLSCVEQIDERILASLLKVVIRLSFILLFRSIRHNKED